MLLCSTKIPLFSILQNKVKPIMKILQKLSHYRISRYFKLLFVIVDVILLNLATVLSSLARFGSLDKLLTKEEQTISLLAIFVWIALLLQNDSNRSIRVEPIESILWRTIKKISFHAAIISISVVYLKYADISRLRMVYFYLIFYVYFNLLKKTMILTNSFVVG